MGLTDYFTEPSGQPKSTVFAIIFQYWKTLSCIQITTFSMKIYVFSVSWTVFNYV